LQARAWHRTEHGPGYYDAGVPFNGSYSWWNNGASVNLGTALPVEPSLQVAYYWNPPDQRFYPLTVAR
jgi:hypothetical protein